jgi:hypothetical protein
MRKLPALLDALGTRLPAAPPRLDLRLAEDPASVWAIEIESFDRRGIRGRAPGDPRRPLAKKWWALAPASRIAVLRSVELSAADLPLAGLFAAANGDLAIAEELWRGVPAGERAAVDEIRALVARAGKSD